MLVPLLRQYQPRDLVANVPVLAVPAGAASVDSRTATVRFSWRGLWKVVNGPCVLAVAADAEPRDS